jgi:hypothetical protein
MMYIEFTEEIEPEPGVRYMSVSMSVRYFLYCPDSGKKGIGRGVLQHHNKRMVS